MPCLMVGCLRKLFRCHGLLTSRTYITTSGLSRHLTEEYICASEGEKQSSGLHCFKSPQASHKFPLELPTQKYLWHRNTIPLLLVGERSILPLPFHLKQSFTATPTYVIIFSEVQIPGCGKELYMRH